MELNLTLMNALPSMALNIAYTTYNVFHVNIIVCISASALAKFLRHQKLEKHLIFDACIPP